MPLAALAVVALLLSPALAAADGCTPEILQMASTQIPNWGRTFQATLPSSAQKTQVVRVDLPKPTDLTLYLSGQAIAQTSVTWLNYSVAVGNGGISIVNERLVAPARGIARHFVASTIEVNAEVRAAAGSGQVRVFGCVAVGRPVEIIEPGIQVTTLGPVDPIPNPYIESVQNTGWTSVSLGLGRGRLFIAPKWSTQMQIDIENLVGAATGAVVEEYSAGGALLISRNVSDYALMTNLDPQTWFVLLSATGAVTYDALVAFKRVT